MMLKIVNYYSFSQFIPRGFESEVLLFKKEGSIRSKEREDSESDRSFCKPKKLAFSEGRFIVI